MIHGLFRAARSRHPLARIAMVVLGVIVALLFLTIGVFALAALVIGGALLMLVNALRSTPRPYRAAGPDAAAPPSSPDVIEGEFKVVSATPAPSNPSTTTR